MKKNIPHTLFRSLILALGTFPLIQTQAKIDPQAKAQLEEMEVSRGVCAVLGLPRGKDASYVLDFVRESKLTIYFQSPEDSELTSLREAADKAGLLGRRVFVEKGAWRKIHLASNLADAVVAASSAREAMDEKELMRTLRPGGKGTG